jgi:hypothetical protein
VGREDVPAIRRTARELYDVTASRLDSTGGLAASGVPAEEDS